MGCAARLLDLPRQSALDAVAVFWHAVANILFAVACFAGARHSSISDPTGGESGKKHLYSKRGGVLLV